MARLKNEKKQTQEFKKNQCPNCGESLNEDAVFCYKCNSFLTSDGKGLLSPEQVTDEDIQRLLDQSQEDQKKNDNTTRGKIGNFMGGMAFIFFILTILSGLFGTLSYTYMGIGVTVVFGILCAVISPSDAETKLDDKAIEEIITKYIAAVECKNVYGRETSFKPDSALPENLILKASFYSPDYTKYQGNRLIKGIWKGFPFSACHVKLMNFVSRKGCKKTINIFDGYCMSIDTDLIFPEKISIIGKRLGCLNIVLKEDKDESDLFYDAFKVKSEHKDIAEDFLTPELRKNIILTCEKYAGIVSVILSPNGNIFIAAGGGEDAFAEGLSAEKVREKYRKQLEFPLKVLQCFSNIENH